jgi:hypothetical protein
VGRKVVTPRVNRNLDVTVYFAHSKVDITVFQSEKLAERLFKEHLYCSSTLNRNSFLFLSSFFLFLDAYKHVRIYVREGRKDSR